MNVVEETTIFKRVFPGDTRMLELNRMKPVKKDGYSELFNGIRYDVYALFTGVSYANNRSRRFKGYRLLPYNSQLPSYNEGLYFIYERKER